MAFRKIAYLIPLCDGCGLAWPVTGPACPGGIPPHFADTATGLAQLPARQIQPRRGCPLMACPACATAAVIPGTAGRVWLLVVAGWTRCFVPFGPVRRPTPARPVAGRPESVTAVLPVGQDDLIAALDDELFPDA